jgi:hypothetical protein
MTSQRVPGLGEAVIDRGTVIRLKGYGLANDELQAPAGAQGSDVLAGGIDVNASAAVGETRELAGLTWRADGMR